MLAAHAAIERMVNLHPGLQLAEIVNGSGSAQRKTGAIGTRLELLRRVRTLSPDINFLILNTTPDSAELARLKLEGFSSEEQRMVVANIKAQQRAFAVAGEVDDTVNLMGAGFHSAAAIAKHTLRNLRQQHRSQ